MLKLLLHLATHHRYGYERDEFYFIACAKRLAWGYVDHPPLVPWFTRLAGEVFGYSLLGLRLLPILALTGGLRLTAGMARRLGGGPYEQGLAALSFLIAPLYLRLGTFLNIPSFEVFFWTLLTWLLMVLLQEDRPRLWLWIGAVAGLGLLNKHSMLLFGFALAVGLLLTPARAYLRSRWLWLGGAIAGSGAAALGFGSGEPESAEPNLSINSLNDAVRSREAIFSHWCSSNTRGCRA